jgi:hypothetical protein
MTGGYGGGKSGGSKGTKPPVVKPPKPAGGKGK